MYCPNKRALPVGSAGARHFVQGRCRALTPEL
jgi:hypothetical protein